MTSRWIVIVVVMLLGAFHPPAAHSYSVLSHEAVIDAAWETGVLPLLTKRFPGASSDQLRQAHAFAYGGAIIQDLGYYPHGSHFFSDLLHYVRSGDFILELIHASRDMNEYAFALGALAHYAADNDGHRVAVNRAVPLLYPKLRKKYSDVVTYEDDPGAHLKTEFGFDVLEVAKQRYAPDSYRDFIGFEVASDLLERAFFAIYSIPLRSLFDDFDKAVRSYRYNIRTMIPMATKVAWLLKKKEIQRDLPGITQRKFLYNLSRASFEKDWGKDYQRPSFKVRLLAFLVRLIPKVGMFKVLKFRTPTPETEVMFMGSFNTVLVNYRHLLEDLTARRLKLANFNFDTGNATPMGAYFMRDGAYARLLDRLEQDQFKTATPELKTDILAYFQHLGPEPRIRQDKMEKSPVDWRKVPQQLEDLKKMASDFQGEPRPKVGRVRTRQSD